MESLLRDLRFAGKALWKNPGYALIAILTLSLGIGANTAVFSVVNAMLLRALPYPQAEQLMYIWNADPERPDERSSLSPHNFTDLRQRSQSFASYFAFRYTSFALTGSGQPQSLSGIMASSDFGRTIGSTPVLGRVFTEEEDAPGKNRVAVISFGLWQRQFAGNSNILGQTIQLNQEPFTIVGVMPAEFAFPAPNIEIWAPLALDLSKYQRGTSFLQSVARLKPGVTQAQAQAETNNIAQQIVRENASSMRELAFNVMPLRTELVGEIEKPLKVLFGAVVLVLLIACVNVANLVLGRATVRWKEIALRTALGASRWSLIRLLLTESVLLGLLGGVLGILLASYGISAMFSIYPDALPNSKTVTIDGVVIAFTFGMSVLTGVIFGLVPALQATKTDLNQALRENSRTASGASNLKLIRSGLIVAEIGFSLLLLVVSGLLLKSFWKLLEVNPGFQTENVVTAQVSLPRARYADEWQQAEFFRRAVENIRAIPGVQSASAATNLPFNNSRGATSFDIDGRTRGPNEDQPVADNHEIFPGYFATLGIPLRAGRDFTEADDRTRPGVVIINERAAQLYWPGENPIGKHLTLGTPEEDKLYGKPVSREIIGVIGNVKLLALNDDFNPEVYIPAAQVPSAGMVLVARGAIPAETLINSLRNAVTAVDPNQPIRREQLLATAVARSVAPQRFMATLLLVFAGVAVALAMVGIYGVMSYAVAQRTQEIGIRMALGAQRRDVLTLILGQGTKLIAIGLGAGLLTALLVTRWLRSLLFEVSTTDVSTFAGVAVLLALVALLACFIPAYRATKANPISALRYE